MDAPQSNSQLSTSVDAPSPPPPSPSSSPPPNVPAAQEDGDSAAPAANRPPSAKGGAYRAIGTEPFWAVTVKGTTATLERPDKRAVRIAVVRESDDRAVRYMADGFAMTVTEGPCSDGMSDAVWSDRVSVAFGEGTLKGCGGERSDPAEEEEL